MIELVALGATDEGDLGPDAEMTRLHVSRR